MDYRIAARRRRVHSDRVRTLVRRMAALTGAVALVAVSVWAINTPMFSVRHVDVVGQTNAVVAGGLRSAGIEPGVPLLLTDTDAAVDAIKLDPWVKAVEIDRQFPDRLVVVLTERIEVAVLDSGMTVSDDGRVMREQPTPGLLTRIRARGGSPNSYVTGATASALELVNYLGPKVTEVDPSDLVAWYDGIQVVFGAPEDLDTKAAVVELMRPEVVAGELLDVSVPERPLIRPPAVAPDASTS